MSARTRDELLADLREVANEIEGYTARWSKAEYLADLAKQRTIERAFEILGEVATRLGNDVPDADVDWRALRNLRVLLAHAYYKVDAARLWAYAHLDVPRILEAL